MLLALIIEEVRGRALADVVRDGVLSGDGLERLVLQPDETPSAPMAMPGGTFCAGEIVSQASLTGMATFIDGYGLGLCDVADPYARAEGHTGEQVGYVAWAGCLPEDGSVVVVLSDRVVEDIGAMARPLVLAARADQRERPSRGAGIAPPSTVRNAVSAVVLNCGLLRLRLALCPTS